jgi:hypothetical protein
MACPPTNAQDAQMRCLEENQRELGGVVTMECTRISRRGAQDLRACAYGWTTCIPRANPQSAASDSFGSFSRLGFAAEGHLIVPGTNTIPSCGQSENGRSKAEGAETSTRHLAQTPTNELGQVYLLARPGGSCRCIGGERRRFPKASCTSGRSHKVYPTEVNFSGIRFTHLPILPRDSFLTIATVHQKHEIAGCLQSPSASFISSPISSPVNFGLSMLRILIAMAGDGSSVRQSFSHPSVALQMVNQGRAGKTEGGNTATVISGAEHFF